MNSAAETLRYFPWAVPGALFDPAALGEMLSSPWLAVPALVLLLVAGWAAITWARRRLVVPKSGPAEAATELEHFRQLHEEGDLSEQEFEEIRRRLSGPPGGA